MAFYFDLSNLYPAADPKLIADFEQDKEETKRLGDERLAKFWELGKSMYLR